MRKGFFKKETVASIRKKDKIEASNNLVEKILDLENKDYLEIKRDLVPEHYTPKRFLKHGTELKLQRTYSQRETLEKKLIPVRQRQEAFNKIKHPFYSGYTFVPSSKDRKIRKVSLTNCLEAAKLYFYAENLASKISIKAYSDSQRVKKEGAVFAVKVPSREKKKHSYEFNLVSVPFIDNDEKYTISSSIRTEGHLCKEKQFMFRYKYGTSKEGSDYHYICAHEIAAYIKVAETSWNKDKNIVPLQMSQFVLPTQFFVDYYKKLENNCLIDGKNLNKAEKEILLWSLVQKQGHDKTCFATEKILNYDWE